MAVFAEDILRCQECESKEFVQKDLLVINKYAKNLDRLETEPLPPNVLEKQVVYVCAKCGTRLDV